MNKSELMNYNCIDFKKLLLLKGKSIALNDVESHLLALMITLREQGVRLITPQVLSQYSSLSLKEIDAVMIKLINSRYLDRQNGILEFKPLYKRLLDEKLEEKKEVNLVERFEDGFGRSLSSTEIEIINTFKRDGFDDAMIIDALYEAVKAGVTNFRYIEKILANWRNYGKKMRNKPEESSVEVEEDIKNLEWWNV